MLFLQPTVRGLAIIRRIVMGSVPHMMIVNNYDRICCSNGCGGHTCYDSLLKSAKKY